MLYTKNDNETDLPVWVRVGLRKLFLGLCSCSMECEAQVRTSGTLVSMNQNFSSSYWISSQEFLGPGSDGWLVPFLKFSLACDNNY